MKMTNEDFERLGEEAQLELALIKVVEQSKLELKSIAIVLNKLTNRVLEQI